MQPIQPQISPDAAKTKEQETTLAIKDHAAQKKDEKKFSDLLPEQSEAENTVKKAEKTKYENQNPSDTTSSSDSADQQMIEKVEASETNQSTEKQNVVSQQNMTPQSTDTIVISTDTNLNLKTSKTEAIENSIQSSQLTQNKPSLLTTQPNDLLESFTTSQIKETKPNQTGLIATSQLSVKAHLIQTDEQNLLQDNLAKLINELQSTQNTNTNLSLQDQIKQIEQKTADIRTPVSDPKWGQVIHDRLLLLIGKNIQKADIQLYPPELGSISAHLKIERGTIDISFIVQNSVVRQALHAAMPILRESLQSEQLTLVNYSVEQQHKESKQDKEGGNHNHSRSDEQEERGNLIKKSNIDDGDSIINYYV